MIGVDVLRSLTRRARDALFAADMLAAGADPMDGTVPGGTTGIAKALGKRPENVHPAVDELVERRLLLRRGQTRAQRLVLVELMRAKGAIAPAQPTPATEPGKVESKEWRQLRARLGGLQRAFEEVQGQRNAARARVTELEAQARAPRLLDVDAERVALLADLAHTSDCLDPDCTRCEGIAQRIEEDRPRYRREHELVGQLERGAMIERASAELVAALRQGGIGAKARIIEASRALQAALDGGV